MKMLVGALAAGAVGAVALAPAIAADRVVSLTSYGRDDLGGILKDRDGRIIERDRFQVKNECNQGGHSAFIRQALYSLL